MNADDLARFARMYLNHGTLDGPPARPAERVQADDDRRHAGDARPLAPRQLAADPPEDSHRHLVQLL